MKEFFFLWMIFTVTVSSVFIEGLYQDDIPEQIVFKACLDKAPILNDSTICNCAEFVGHPSWCDGDIKY